MRRNIRVSSLFDYFYPGPENTQWNTIFRLASGRAGTASNTFSKVNEHCQISALFPTVIFGIL